MGIKKNGQRFGCSSFRSISCSYRGAASRQQSSWPLRTSHRREGFGIPGFFKRKASAAIFRANTARQYRRHGCAPRRETLSSQSMPLLSMERMLLPHGRNKDSEQVGNLVAREPYTFLRRVDFHPPVFNADRFSCRHSQGQIYQFCYTVQTVYRYNVSPSRPCPPRRDFYFPAFGLFFQLLHVLVHLGGRPLWRKSAWWEMLLCPIMRLTVSIVLLPI